MTIAMTGARRTIRFAVAGAAAVLSACASSRTTTPLPLEPVAYTDTLPIDRPKEREINEVKRLILVAAGGELGYGLSLRRMVGQKHEAINSTRFDDIVNSAWFEHRIGLGGMTPEDVARGPTTVGPDTSRELTVIAGKTAGISPAVTATSSSSIRRATSTWRARPA